jgi:hypothetical protein
MERMEQSREEEAQVRELQWSAMLPQDLTLSEWVYLTRSRVAVGTFMTPTLSNGRPAFRLICTYVCTVYLLKILKSQFEVFLKFTFEGYLLNRLNYPHRFSILDQCQFI